MFKKKCPSCTEKVDRKFDFCPFCGVSLKNQANEYGILGKDDKFSEADMFSAKNSIIEQMLNKAMRDIPNLMKQMEKEMSPNNVENGPAFPPNMKIRLAINGKEIDLSNMNPAKTKEKKSKKVIQKLSDDQAKRFAEFPRIEPKTTMKRLSGKLIYELEIPGVESINDIIINQLENSMEIKALSTDKVYSKNLNVNIPIVSYKLDNDRLILELAGN